MHHHIACLCITTALKIQVSGATADLLHTLKGYTLTCRGTLNVKVRFMYGTGDAAIEGFIEMWLLNVCRFLICSEQQLQ